MVRCTAVVTMLFALSLSAQTPETNGVVLPINAAPQLLVPAAGSTPGANGTFFRSDITLINFGDVAQRVQLRWWPQVGGTTAVTDINIPARTGISSEDFVNNYLGVQGLGSLLITGVTSTEALDPNAKLFATSRIWTPQPGTTGTTSQSLDVVRPGPTTMATAAIFGLRRDSRYRVNVGIVNLDSATTVTFVITVSAAGAIESYTVTIPPTSMQQVPLTTSTSPVSQITITSGSGATTLWTAYGSSIDNVTGDSWSELAIAGQ
ncbi:MAG TPA: hypothetical protein VGS96_12150 [Thermoanaerobaculia bacterium]|nr:hypothetical protein [Thermoanaerobaculia bacterium]